MDPRPTPASPPRRPLLGIAAALAAGAAAGPRLGTAWIPAAAAAALALFVLARRAAPIARVAEGAAEGLGVGSLPLVLLFTLAAVRAAQDGARLPPLLEPDAAHDLALPRGTPRVGRWRSRGRGRGWIEPPDGPGPALLFECDGPAPAEGEWVAILAGGAGAPWPRGPVRGPRAAEGRFAGTAWLPADELVRWMPPESRRSPLGQLSALVRPRMKGIRRGLVGRLRPYEPGLPVGLSSALLLGDRRRLPRETADLFTRTGTRHLLAVSGLHVVLVGFVVLGPLAALLRRLARGLGSRASERAVVGLRALALFVYAALVGGAPPVARAALALVLGLFAPHLPGGGRRVDTLSLWSLALCIELVADSGALLALGVQLSYLATLGILVGTRPLARILGARGGAGQPGEPGATWRAIGGRLVGWVRLGWSSSAAAVLATLPILWGSFGAWCPWGITAFPLVLPVFAALLAGLWAAALAPGWVPAAAVHLPARLLFDLLGLCDGLPATPSPLPERPSILVAGICWAGLAALGGARGLVRPVLLLAGATLLPWEPAPAGLEIHALDVGHGTAIVVRGPGEPCLVFDAGSRDRARVEREALAPLLARWEVRRPRIVLSHVQRDHASALAWLVERHPPRGFLGALPAPLRERLPHDCVRVEPRGGRVALGGRGPLRLALLRAFPGRSNEASCFLELSWGAPGPGGAGAGRVLLAGDAEGEGLRTLLERDLLPPGPLRLLLLPHHGSDTPLLAPLLDRLAPARVWISTSGEVPVGRELDRRGVPWASTTGGPLAFFLPPPPPEGASAPRGPTAGREDGGLSGNRRPSAR